MMNNRKIFLFQKRYFFCLFFLLSCLFFPKTAHADFIDDTQNDFDSGTHTNTQWDASNNWLEMTGTGQTNGFATFTSRIIDVSSSLAWSSLNWVPIRPLYKELPNSKGVESSYSTGNADMTNNVLLFHLNESLGSLSDSSGSLNTGTANGSPTYNILGRFNTAIIFDGLNDYITVADTTTLKITGDLTLSAWVKRTGGNATYRGIVGKMAIVGGTNYKGYTLQMGNDNKFRFAVAHNLTTTDRVISNTTYTDSNWHHVVGVKSSGNLYLYVDGVLQTDTLSGATITDTGAALTIGRIYSSTDDFYFVGPIDEVAVYSRALSASEVLANYKRGALRARFQVRSCDDSVCSGESFVATGAATTAYFEEQDSNTTSLPSFNLSGIAGNNQYFQYRVAFESSSSTLSPEIGSVTIGSTASEGGGGGGGGGGNGDTGNSVPEVSDILSFFLLLAGIAYTGKVALPKLKIIVLSFRTRYEI